MSKAYISLSNCETGAPEIDPKRPYGNSDVAGDVAEILGIDMPEYDTDGYDDAVSEMLDIHYGTVQALQIILHNQTFELGVYQAKTTTGYDIMWVKV